KSTSCMEAGSYCGSTTRICCGYCAYSASKNVCDYPSN
nr:RecName: Full=Omega-conotoxin-like S6.7; Flags: Precursor [Conus striatus]